MDKVGMFQDLDEKEADDPHKLKAHEAAEKKLEEQRLKTQLERNTENMEAGRCKPACAKIDRLHSMAWSLPPGCKFDSELDTRHSSNLHIFVSFDLFFFFLSS